MAKFQAGTILTCLTMDGQTHVIGKAIRLLFADPVTYTTSILQVKVEMLLIGPHVMHKEFW